MVVDAIVGVVYDIYISDTEYGSRSSAKTTNYTWILEHRLEREVKVIDGNYRYINSSQVTVNSRQWSSDLYGSEAVKLAHVGSGDRTHLFLRIGGFAPSEWPMDATKVMVQD